MPAEGNITTTVSITLTANCRQTGKLSVYGGGSLTIVGQRFTIDASALNNSAEFVNVATTGSLTMSNVTVKGGGQRNRFASLHLDGSTSLTNVTVRDTGGMAINVGASSGSGQTYSFSGILVENARESYIHSGQWASAIQADNGASLTVSNLVARNNLSGNAAIGARQASSIVISGCFTSERNFPQATSTSDSSTITDSSSGKCSGTIGNQDNAVSGVAAPIKAGCGLPAQGVLQEDATYTLIDHCQQTGRLYIPKGITVTINGNGYSIRAAANSVPFASAANLTIRYAVITGATGFSMLTYLPNTLTIENSIFRSNTGPINIVDHSASFSNVLFESNSTSRTGLSRSSAVRVLRASTVTIRNSSFISNTGGDSVLFTGESNSFGSNASVTLAGCITWQSNTPKNIDDPNSLLTDNSTGACSAKLVLSPTPFGGGARGAAGAAAVPTRPSATEPGPGVMLPGINICESQAGVEAIPMGVVACIFRQERGEDYLLSVYGIDAASQGYHMLTASQSQLEGLSGEQVVAVSADGRALLVLWPDRNVTVKVGPDHERKILHFTFRGSLSGPLIDKTTTYGDAPGLPYLNSVGAGRGMLGPPTSMPAFEGEGLSNCFVTTLYILNLRERPGGDIIGLVSYDATLAATARESGWYKVAVDGRIGWVSGEYALARGSCG